jgi:aminomethyltransferase
MADPADLSLLRTPLYGAIVALGAKMTAFGGWAMPVQFAGLREEHGAVRSRLGIFDISHMGKFELVGGDPIAALDRLVPSDLSILTPGRGKYTVLLNDRGGIIDDLIVYCAGPGRLVAIVNAATTAKDRAWLEQQLAGSGTALVDLSRDRVLLAVQGPSAAAMLQPWAAADLGAIKRYGFVETELLGAPAFVARTGYTGEDGFEIMLDPDAGVALWRSLLEAGAQPCGLGARDTLRLEAAMALYGQDVTEETTPIEAGLGWLVHCDRKGDFVGRAVLERQLAQGCERQLVGLQLEGRHIARSGYGVFAGGDRVGTVTSGTLSPTLGIPIAIAQVATAQAQIGQLLEVDIRGQRHPAQVVPRPFYKRPKS